MRYLEVVEGEQREPVRLPAEVFEGLEDVHRSGRANMHDRYTVQRLAYEFGHHATVLWIEENPRLYARGMLYGFECGS